MATELIVPALGESITEATLAKWLKKVGDTVALDEPVAELETDKVTVALPAPKAGVLTVQKTETGATVRIGDSIGILDESKGMAGNPSTPSAINPSSSNTPPASTPAKDVPQKPPVSTPPRNEPSVVSSAQTTAPPGPALSPSQRQALREQGSAATVVPSASVARTPSLTPDTQENALEEVVPMSPLRKRIAERLVEAQHTAAILTTFNEVDMTAIMALRSKHQEAFTQKHGVKLGFMSFFAKACVEALKQFPSLNAEVRGESIVYKKHYDFGIAVGSGKGLVVPVIRDVDRLNFAEIEKAILDKTQKAKENKLSLADLSGGTFSITNGGIYGSMMSTPLLNLPQTGILGMHNIIRRPVAVGEAIEIRPMMYVALSYDHRVADGREAVQCLVSIKEHLESPDKLLLGL